MNHSLMSSTRSTSKGKKRPKSNVGGSGSSGGASPCSPPEQEPPSTLRRKVSAKKPPKKAGSHEPNGDGQLLSLDAASLYNNPPLPPLPPQYDDRLDGPPPVPAGLMTLDFAAQATQPPPPAQQPPTYLPYSQFQEPSPPHSVTFSPPAVSRTSLPTSPPHMAAMRIATHQSHASTMHYTDPFAMGAGVLSNPTYQPAGQPQQLPSQIYHFLTPPSEPTERNSYPTPSPESPPYYWSSSSPHSNSDWSEGILSPNSSSHLNKQSEPTFV